MIFQNLHAGTVSIVVAVTVSSLLLALFIVSPWFLIKLRKARQGTEHASGADLNPTYGDYIDPDPRVEVVDNNENYSPEYVIGSSRITDNNPYYE